jgi:bifunctional ADP-heptose synthase (sugar kinase/adenylyltransferase)
VPARAIKTADVSGAGDTVISIATLAYIKDYPFRKIAQLSNAAAGKVCRKIGIAPITLKELKLTPLIARSNVKPRLMLGTLFTNRWVKRSQFNINN